MQGRTDEMEVKIEISDESKSVDNSVFTYEDNLLIEQIVKELGSTDDAKELENYKDQLKSAQSRIAFLEDKLSEMGKEVDFLKKQLLQNSKEIQVQIEEKIRPIPELEEDSSEEDEDRPSPEPSGIDHDWELVAPPNVGYRRPSSPVKASENKETLFLKKPTPQSESHKKENYGNGENRSDCTLCSIF